VADLRDLVLSMSAERAVWQARERAAFKAGRALGRREGWDLCDRRREQEFRAWVTDAPIPGSTRTYAELERRRYGRGGRARFGRPRRGDFRGQEPRR
jgi:hypothetical protein